MQSAFFVCCWWWELLRLPCSLLSFSEETVMRRVGKFIGCCLIAVSLRLHKPMTTCRDTVADWRLIYRVLFAFSKFAWFTSVKKSIAPPPGKYNIASALLFHVIQYNSGCFWRASFPSRKSGVFCCRFFGDDPVVCRCRSPPPFDSLVNHPWIEIEVHNEEN